VDEDDSSDGIGCIGAFLVLGAIGWVLQHIVAILVGLLLFAIVLGAAWGLGSLAVAALQRAAERANCPVCQNWSASVLLTDLAPDDVLCSLHGERLHRIAALEREALPDD
jgi:hypothetical protein